jgi:hypothetical protein
MERGDEEKNKRMLVKVPGQSFQRFRGSGMEGLVNFPESGVMNAYETKPERRKIAEYLAPVMFTGKNAYV